MRTNRFIGSILLIAGTAIGAGMIALPVVSGVYGFFSAALLFIIVWIFTTYAAFLLLEVNLWFNKDCNIITMAKNTLGKPGQTAAWILSVFFLYTLMVAYISGLGEMFTDTLTTNFSLNLSSSIGAVFFSFVFAFFVAGKKANLDYLNRLFIIGLAISYIVLIVSITPNVNTTQILTIKLQSPLTALPVAMAAFGYTVVVSSIRNYLGNNVKQLKWAIVIGGAVPLFIYLFWEFVVLGVIPLDGEVSLLAILEHGDAGTGITNALQYILNNPYIIVAARFFVFFAIASSFTGVSMGLYDILADGLNIPHAITGKILNCSFTFLPPLVISLLFPKVFILALGYAGVLNVMLFFILPALMVLRGRTLIVKTSPTYQTFGGNTAISILLIFCALVIAVEFAMINKWI